MTPSQLLQSAYTVASASQGLFGGSIRWDMKIKRLPAGFVVPAQPVKASKPPSGPDWVHEIKHDGYRLIVRRDGPIVRLYTRNAYDWTVRLPAIAAAAGRIKAKSFTIDGEAVVLGPDGLSRFEELRRRSAAHAAILYAFDLIEHDGEDLRDRPLLNRKTYKFVLAQRCHTHSLSRRRGDWLNAACVRNWPNAAVVGIRLTWQLSGDKLPANELLRHRARTRRRGWPYSVRTRLPTWRGGHCLQEGRRHLSIRSMPGVD